MRRATRFIASSLVLVALTGPLTVPAVAMAVPLASGFAAHKRGDYTEALRCFRRLATETEAQFSLGFMYQNGQGVPQDDAEALKWYRLAAEQGNAFAQFNLAVMYFQGRGVPQDDLEAAKWFCLSAKKGIADAQYNLAVMYFLGRGVPQNDLEAAKWFRLAAGQGNALAQNGLGFMYDKGQGVPQDDLEAAKWFHLSAEQGVTEAQFNLAVMYFLGRGVPQDDTEAAKWFRLSAEQGMAEAQSNLGFMYANGRGVPKDDALAHIWYNLAAAGASDPKSGYEPSPLVNLHDPAERERLSRSGIKAFFNIMQTWEIKDADARDLLGDVSDGVFYEMKKNPNLVLDTDRLTRISLLIGIFKSLNILYPEDLADAWVLLPNKNHLFSGGTPLSYMVQGGLEAMWTVRRLVDSRAAG